MKADKGNSIVNYMKLITIQKEMFLANNSFQLEPHDPTKLFQTEVRQNINSCTLYLMTENWNTVI
jgi:hypothetical protein